MSMRNDICFCRENVIVSVWIPVSNCTGLLPPRYHFKRSLGAGRRMYFFFVFLKVAVALIAGGRIPRNDPTAALCRLCAPLMFSGPVAFFGLDDDFLWGVLTVGDEKAYGEYRKHGGSYL